MNKFEQVKKPCVICGKPTSNRLPNGSVVCEECTEGGKGKKNIGKGGDSPDAGGTGGAVVERPASVKQPVVTASVDNVLAYNSRHKAEEEEEERERAESQKKEAENAAKQAQAEKKKAAARETANRQARAARLKEIEEAKKWAMQYGISKETRERMGNKSAPQKGLQLGD